MMKTWMFGIASAALGLLTIVGSVQAQRTPPVGRPVRPAQVAEPTTAVENAPAAENPAPAALAPGNEVGNGRRARPAGDLPGPIDNPQDVRDTAKMAFMAADANHDGQISKKEATDAANHLVGGFFFRADANGDGVLSKEEAQQARQQFLAQNPILRLFAQEAKRQGNANGQPGGTQPNPFQGMATLLDSNNDQQVSAKEVRQAVQTGIDGLYAQADTNRDSQLSPNELRAFGKQMAQAAGQAAFQAADKDNNGALSKDEFNQAILQPAQVVFGVIDANHDGQISQDEAQQAQRYIMERAQHAQQLSSSLDRQGSSPTNASPEPAPAQAPQP